jgi:hypothetical protein
MISRHFLAVLILFLAFGANIAAQNREYTPYVSHIEIEARNNLIRLNLGRFARRQRTCFYFQIRPAFFWLSSGKYQAYSNQLRSTVLY